MKKIAYILTIAISLIVLSCKKYPVPPVGGGTGGGTGSTHTYVDLGLPSGLLWATCNVGATNPEDYGDYFAWGETLPKSNYDWSTYQWCNGSSSILTKYCTSGSYGTVDNKTVLELADDAAHVNWGGDWRMPTKEEWQELYDNTTSTWTTQNGVYGRRFTSTVAGHTGVSLFLPAAGNRLGTSLDYDGYDGYYWSSSLDTSLPILAYDLLFHSFNVLPQNDYGRSLGFSVRPVRSSQDISTPTMTTSNITEITSTTATCGGNVTSDGGATVTARGVCWSTSQNPTISNSHTTDGSGTGSFISSITGLSANTTYYVRAYATNSAGTSYGDQKSFTTQSGGGGTHAYVDLGLPSGLLWATCNIGATNPEDYGDYYAWGETSPKSDYSWSTYQWCNGSNTTLTKYCTQSSYGYNGFVDNKTVLEPDDDAAHVNWGGDWRMPTTQEWLELNNNTTSTWTTQNGVYGRRFTSTVAGHTGVSLFLPAAGRRYGTSLSDAGSDGYCWSSSLDASYPYSACNVGFNSDYVISQDFSNRGLGFSVRPVR